MKIKYIKFLGIASNSFEALNTTSFVIMDDIGTGTLIDCGPDIPRQLTHAKIPFLDITNVVLTHSHLDHTLGFPYFLFGRSMEAKRFSMQHKTPAPSLRVISSPEIFARLISLFEHFHPDAGDLLFSIEHVSLLETIDSPISLSVGNFSAIRANHRVECFGFRIFDGVHSLAYSSDSLPTDQFISIATGTTIVIHEAMAPESERGFCDTTKHSTTQDAGMVFAATRPKQGLMVHIRPTFYQRISELEAEASKAAGFSVRYPKEGEEIPFGEFESTGVS